MSDVPITSARHNLKAESRFSSAEKTITARHLDVGLALFDQTETSARPLPQPLMPRVNTLRLTESSFPQMKFQPEETALPADTRISLMSLPDRLQWIPPKKSPPPYLQVAPPASTTPSSKGSHSQDRMGVRRKPRTLQRPQL
jgi:hypothetical protein